MAKSGSLTHPVTTWDDLIFNWNVTNQSIEDNTSTVAWSMQLKSKAYGAINSTASKKWSVSIGGNNYSGTNSIAVGNNTTKTLASGSTILNHTPSGTLSFPYTFSQQFDITFDGRSIGTITRIGTGQVDSIPRASQPSCITWPEHTQNVGEFGDTISIHMNRQASVFTHTVRYQFGEQKGTIATGVGTGTTWTIPLSLMNLIPETTKGSGTIYVDTYEGTTFVGTKYCGFTATVPASIKPSCSFTLDDVANIEDLYGQPVQSLSRIKVSVSTTTAYSSPIASCIISANGATYSGTEATTAALKAAGDSPVTVTVKDKRGRTGSASYTMKVLEYAAPVISKFAVHRCKADGTEDSGGGYIKITFSSTISPLKNLNSNNWRFGYKKTSDAQFLEAVLDPGRYTYTLTDYEEIFPADVNSSYDVFVSATDKHNGTRRDTVASTGFVLMSWGEDGRSVGLLKVAERPDAVDIGGDVYMNGHALYGAHGIEDTRETNESPSWYMTNHGRGVVWEFKQLTAVGFTAPSSNFGPMQTIIPWKDQSGGLPRQVVYEGRNRWTRIANSLEAWGAWQSDALIAYPVGSIYIAYNHTNPGTLFGGTWERITNAFLWAADASGTIGQTGGAKEVALTVKELPAHSHGSVYSQHAAGTKNAAWYTASGTALAYGAVETGGGEAHNNMPPYIQVSIWRRTA